METKKLVVFGCHGQLGIELVAVFTERGYRVTGFDRSQVDIGDSAHVEQPQMPLVPFLDGYETVAEMEAGLGMPAGSLGKTLDRYNHHAALGQDPDFHKSADWLAPQDQGPWAVFDLRPGHALYAGFTLGGLRTTVDAQVRRPDGSVIPGLYAAGLKNGYGAMLTKLGSSADSLPSSLATSEPSVGKRIGPCGR